LAVHRILALSLTLASAPSFAADAPTTQSPHPAASEHLPFFVTAPGQTDVLMVIMAITLAVAVVGFGIFFLRLHTLPERVAHKGHKIQFEIVVAILGLIALFTHMHIFWVAGLLLAFIDIPDFGGFLGRIAGSVERIAGVKPGAGAENVPDLDRADDAGHAGSESAPRKPPRIVAGKKELDHA